MKIVLSEVGKKLKLILPMKPGQLIEKEKQSSILNQNVVGDSQLAIIIDNAKPVLKLPKIAKNR